jgi:hypothetical protein
MNKINTPTIRGEHRKIIEENTYTKKSLAESIGAPLISSPFIFGDVGGISLASILDDVGSSQGLNIALSLIIRAGVSIYRESIDVKFYIGFILNTPSPS